MLTVHLSDIVTNHIVLFLPTIQQGRFTIAAKHHISIAEIYETELVDIDKVSKTPGKCLSFYTHTHNVE